MFRAWRSIANARSLRRGSTDAERRLWRELRGRRFIDVKFRRQHPIGRYVVDFVAPSLGLVIELDGGQHAERVEEDRERTEFLERHGFRVLRFWNTDVIESSDAVLERILYEVRLRDGAPPHPDPLPNGERG